MILLIVKLVIRIVIFTTSANFPTPPTLNQKLLFHCCCHYCQGTYYKVRKISVEREPCLPRAVTCALGFFRILGLGLGLGLTVWGLGFRV